MIVLASLIVLLKGVLVFTIFCIVHPIPTSPFIQLNDFCTCITHLQRPQLTSVVQLTTVAYLAAFLLVKVWNVSIFLSLMI